MFYFIGLLFPFVWRACLELIKLPFYHLPTHKIMVKFFQTNRNFSSTFPRNVYINSVTKTLCQLNMVAYSICNVNQSKRECCMCHVVCQEIEPFLDMVPHVFHCFSCSFSLAFNFEWEWLIWQKAPDSKSKHLISTNFHEIESTSLHFHCISKVKFDGKIRFT